ncbi:MAG: YrhB domain-containing protein [Anaerolineae bacterium]
MTQDEALQIAQEILAQQIDIADDDAIICTHAETTDEGWYLECNSRKYIETDDLLYALVVAPLVIRPDGTHRFVY